MHLPSPTLQGASPFCTGQTKRPHQEEEDISSSMSARLLSSDRPFSASFYSQRAAVVPAPSCLADAEAATATGLLSPAAGFVSPTARLSIALSLNRSSTPRIVLVTPAAIDKAIETRETTRRMPKLNVGRRNASTTSDPTNTGNMKSVSTGNDRRNIIRRAWSVRSTGTKSSRDPEILINNSAFALSSICKKETPSVTDARRDRDDSAGRARDGAPDGVGDAAATPGADISAAPATDGSTLSSGSRRFHMAAAPPRYLRRILTSKQSSWIYHFSFQYSV